MNTDKEVESMNAWLWVGVISLLLSGALKLWGVIEDRRREARIMAMVPEEFRPKYGKRYLR